MEYRFKPAITQSMLLHSGLASWNNPWTTDTRMMYHVSIEYTGSYSGSADYGRIHYCQGGGAASTTPMTASSDWIPLQLLVQMQIYIIRQQT